MKGLILIYLITAISVVGSFRYPLLGLYVYIGFAVLRPQEIWGFAGDMLGLSNIIAIPMIIGWMLQGFGSWKFGKGRIVVISLLLFIFWFALSGETGMYPSTSRIVLREFLKVILPVIVGVTLLTEKRHWMTLLWIIVLCEGYVGLEMHSDYYLKGFNHANMGFGAGDNNFFGLALVTVLGPALALAITSRKWYQKLAAGTCAALILHTTLLTFSRGAFVGLLAMGVAAFVLMPKRPRNLIGLAAAIGLAVTLTGPELARRYASTFESEESRDGSAQSRVDLWRSCLIVIGDYPILGIGPGNWVAVANQYGWPDGKSAHSIWMELAADTGIPGAVLLLTFFGVTGLRLWPIARAKPTEENREEIGMATGGVLAIVGFVVAGQFVTAPAMEVPYYVITVAIAMLRPPLPAESGVHVPARGSMQLPMPVRVPVPAQAMPIRTPLQQRRVTAANARSVATREAIGAAARPARPVHVPAARPSPNGQSSLFARQAAALRTARRNPTGPGDRSPSGTRQD
jgi:probable O-glycosylation ligase (exosortase A-associated)